MSSIAVPDSSTSDLKAGTSKHFPMLDGLRAFAALSVLIFHVGQSSGAIESAAWGSVLASLNSGVAVFFFISGFLLYRPFVASRLAGRPARAKSDFYLARVLRIVPAYWAALVVLELTIGLEGDVLGADWYWFFGFIQAWSPEHLSEGIPAAWSLGVEMTFYLLLPLYAACIARVAPARSLGVEVVVLCGLGAASFLAHRYMPADLGLTYPTCFFLFVPGMLTAVVTEHATRSNIARAATAGATRIAVWCWVVGVALLLAYVLRAGRDVAVTQAPYAIYGFLIGLPAVLVASPRSVHFRVLTWAPLAWLGLVSYGIYLWHGPIIEWTAGRLDLDVLAETVALFAIGSSAAVVAAAISYYGIEQRATSLRRR